MRLNVNTKERILLHLKSELILDELDVFTSIDLKELNEQILVTICKTVDDLVGGNASQGARMLGITRVTYTKYLRKKL